MGGNRCPHRGRRRGSAARSHNEQAVRITPPIEAELDDIARLQIFGAAFYAAQAVFAVGAREKSARTGSTPLQAGALSFPER